MFVLHQIATVHNEREEIRDDFWGGVITKIEMNHAFDEESLLGIEDFSHLEIIYYFDRVKDENIQYGARHPRNNPSYPLVGIFAQRGKNRPNKLGATIVKLLKREGKTLYVSGLDAVNGTPVIDIKPVFREFLPHDDIKQPSWTLEIMKEYWNG